MTTNSINSLRLETPRLYLIPLTYEQLLLYATPNGKLESELGLLPGDRQIAEDFKRTIETYLISYIEKNPEYILYATLWVMVERNKNIIIGDLGFNAAPSDKGVIEWGYSTYPDYMNQGYMTEALAALAEWAFTQPEVKIIIAQTHKDNFATHTVLAKLKFAAFAEADQFYWWRLDKEGIVEDN